MQVTVLAEKIAQRSERRGTVHRGELITLAGRVQRPTRFGAVPVTVLAYCRPSSLPRILLATLGGLETSMHYL
jgi:hypothetical protein